MVDTISSLASIDYRHDAWGVDVTVAGFAERADAAARPGLQRSLGEGAGGAANRPACHAPIGTGRPCLAPTGRGSSPTRRPTNLLFGLQGGSEPAEGGRPRRRVRPACALRRRHPGCRSGLGPRDPVPRAGRSTRMSSPVFASLRASMPTGSVTLVLERFDMSLGQGLGRLKGRDVSDRPSRGSQRSVAGRHAVRVSRWGSGRSVCPLSASGVLAAQEMLLSDG